MDVVTIGAQVYATAGNWTAICVARGPATKAAAVLFAHPKGAGSNYSLGSQRVAEENT